MRFSDLLKRFRSALLAQPADAIVSVIAAFQACWIAWKQGKVAAAGGDYQPFAAMTFAGLLPPQLVSLGGEIAQFAMREQALRGTPWARDHIGQAFLNYVPELAKKLPEGTVYPTVASAPPPAAPHTAPAVALPSAEIAAAFA